MPGVRIIVCSPYLVQMREKMDQKIYKYGHFLRSVTHCDFLTIAIF